MSIAPEGTDKFKGLKIPVRSRWNEIMASKGLSAKGFYSAVDPLDSTSTLLQPRSLEKYKDVKIPLIQSISMIPAWDNDYLCGIVPEDYVARKRRHGRKVKAEDFRREYLYGRSMDKKTCIWPGNGVFSWSDDSSGITWVGVHGNDTICVVTKAGDLDLTRVHGFLIFRTKEEVLRNFRRTVVSEIEDLADPNSKLREMCGKSIQTPFGVVSVVPVNDKVHKASSDEYEESKVVKFVLEYLNRDEATRDDDYEIDENDEDYDMKYALKLTLREKGFDSMIHNHHPRQEIVGYDKKKSIKYLLEEMKRDADIPINEVTIQESSDEYDEENAIEFLHEKVKVKGGEDFTLEGTIQIAISTFQHLFGKKFKANEIEVSIMDPEYFVCAEEAYYKDIYVKHLETREIEQLLVDMNEPGTGGSSSGSSTISYENID